MYDNIFIPESKPLDRLLLSISKYSTSRGAHEVYFCYGLCNRPNLYAIRVFNGKVKIECGPDPFACRRYSIDGYNPFAIMYKMASIINGEQGLFTANDLIKEVLGVDLVSCYGFTDPSSQYMRELASSGTITPPPKTIKELQKRFKAFCEKYDLWW